MRRWGIFSQRGIEDTRKLAKIINDEKVELALFQGIPNKNFLDQLLSNLGDNWTSAVFSEDKNQTAIISKIGKGSETFRSEVADISMVAFEKDETWYVMLAVTLLRDASLKKDESWWIGCLNNIEKRMN